MIYTDVIFFQSDSIKYHKNKEPVNQVSKSTKVRSTTNKKLFEYIIKNIVETNAKPNVKHPHNFEGQFNTSSSYKP